ncbi:MAG: T9SS type A sorting domain-containing protein [Flavobacteriales bacterium]|nr:T9SS type A sorting domain-containing protein [Flavobacteriales bacterium]
MNRTILFTLLSLLPLSGFAQGLWQVTPLADMPEPVSNNAVATSGNYVFSFMGIDSTKVYSGIHLKGFRYDIANDTWDTIAPVPDNLSRIAASASTVNGKIYIIGGYHVFQNGNEVSSNKVFIYDPDSNSYTSGTNVGIATDDHVQIVWKDSLIYVISGWSNTGNITAVQIYDPGQDTWTLGTSLPGGNDYKAFGASGVIIGNTIYFTGGVTDTWVFSMIPKIRTGLIDPGNPAVITWSIAEDSLGMLYRSGAGILNGQPVWFGGADKAYNFDGIEYGSGLGVEPLNRVTTFDTTTATFSIEDGVIANFMDMRGIAQIDSNKYIIAGGMGPGQEVSAKTYLLEYVIPQAIGENGGSAQHFSIHPNPASDYVQIQFKEKGKINNWNITDITGRIVSQGQQIPSHGLSVRHLQNGIYTLQITTDNQLLTAKFVRNK